MDASKTPGWTGKILELFFMEKNGITNKSKVNYHQK